jgi:hypothetical protein
VHRNNKTPLLTDAKSARGGGGVLWLKTDYASFFLLIKNCEDGLSPPISIFKVGVEKNDKIFKKAKVEAI